MEKYAWDGIPPLIDIHSIKKHHVIEEYLFQYIRILGGTVYNVHHLDLTIIDGFAGGGLYRQHDGTLHDGSPLICLRSTEAAAALVAQKKPFTLNAHYFFIDRNRQSLEFLRSLLKERGYGGRLEKDIFLKRNRTVIEHITSRSSKMTSWDTSILRINR